MAAPAIEATLIRCDGDGAADDSVDVGDGDVDDDCCDDIDDSWVAEATTTE